MLSADALLEHFAVPLRGLAVASQSLAVGGVSFLLLLASPLAARLGPVLGTVLLKRAGRLTAWAGLAVAAVAVTRISLQLAVLVTSAGLPIERALGAGFVAAWGMQAAAGLLIAAVLARRRESFSGLSAAGCLVLAATAILIGSVATSHAPGRLDWRPSLAAITLLHELGAAVWIGGLPCFLAALAMASDNGPALRLVGRRFSLMAMGGVVAITGAGAALAVAYVESWAALYGTTFGMLVGVKTVLVTCLLCLGAANYRIVERLRRDPSTPTLRLRRFAEVEVGLGLAVFVAAASLASAPPAVDIGRDSVSIADIAERIWPPTPQIQSPRQDPRIRSSLEAPPAAPSRPDTTERQPINLAPRATAGSRVAVLDAAWSEYEHDWAGLLLIAVGALAIAERLGAARARSWPLLLVAFALFLTIESDPGIRMLDIRATPEDLRDDRTAEHHWASRHFLTFLVAVAFILVGLCEWAVRSGYILAARARLVFPMACMGGGLLLLAHGHTGADIQQALLTALSHSVVALFGLAAGVARWVELRMPETRIGYWAAWTWPGCLIAAGLVLLVYRE